MMKNYGTCGGNFPNGDHLQKNSCFGILCINGEKLRHLWRKLSPMRIKNGHQLSGQTIEMGGAYKKFFMKIRIILLLFRQIVIIIR
jgi:hypothetical protein